MDEVMVDNEELKKEGGFRVEVHGKKCRQGLGGAGMRLRKDQEFCVFILMGK